jgi:hypothetical protein
MDDILILFFPKLNFPIFIHCKDIYKVIGISDLITYLITSHLHTTLPEITKLSALLLTIPATNASGEWSFFV